MNFKPLLVQNYKEIKVFFENHKSDLCVYSPASIIVWNNYVSTPNFLIENDILYISNIFADESSKDHLIMPLSKSGDILPYSLYETAQKLGFNKYWFIPEYYVEENRDIEKYFEIEEQKDYEDYIYDSMDLASLKGKKYSKKRNLINQFKKDYVDNGRILVEDLNDQNFKETLTFLEEWFDEKDFDKDDDDFKTEKMAAESALENYKELELDSLVLKIDGKVAGYTQGTAINKKTWVLHFEKASASIKGLYQFLDRETARRVYEKYKFINKESDMGVEGIAHSKRSYYPLKRYKSFILRLK